jgi:hypothetical protein
VTSERKYINPSISLRNLVDEDPHASALSDESRRDWGEKKQVVRANIACRWPRNGLIFSEPGRAQRRWQEIAARQESGIRTPDSGILKLSASCYLLPKTKGNRSSDGLTVPHANSLPCVSFLKPDA